jgi:pimeloyl-ACP methyl ester carboxylesterase
VHLFSSGSGYPVLFIHGMPTSGRLWDGVISKLRGQFHCLAVDLPGLSFQQHVDHLVLLSPAMFPELKPFRLFRFIRTPFLGEILAPLVSVIFWNVVMRIALESRHAKSANAVREFRAPFSGMRGAWRFMSVMRYGNPAELLKAVPGMLPHLSVPTLIFHGAQDTAVPQSFARRASALIPESKVLVVDSGHFIPLTKPETVANELCRFFDASAVA